MIRLLHITIDDKFFDSIYQKFDEDDRIENSAICLVNDRFKKFKYIKNINNVIPLTGKAQIKNFLKNNVYDVIYFHSLHARHWWIINHIPKDKKIIWWAWGYDLYYGWRGSIPHINIALLKPITRIFVKDDRNIVRRGLEFLFFKFISGPLLTRKFKKDIVKRINYFQPVLHIEYELMKQYKGFTAKEFYYPSKTLVCTNINFMRNKILVGNSGTPSNNHLDIMKKISRYNIDLKRVIIPINYGDKVYIKNLTMELEKNYSSVNLIKDFMSKDSYFDMISSCSHAIFGVMRQQAMGNIYRMLMDGVKIFLYKDSIPYQYLTSVGFRIYTIEDMTFESISTPLSEDEIETNRQIHIKEQFHKNNIYNNVIDEINKYLDRKNLD